MITFPTISPAVASVAHQVSAPMAPICRTESVVHNATMAVLLEGIVPRPEDLGTIWVPFVNFTYSSSGIMICTIWLIYH